jgi:K+-sensing histidine kinase KdpD
MGSMRSASGSDGMKLRGNSLFQDAIFRYLFGIAAVASAFVLRIWLIPLTGTGAPFVLFLAAVLVTSLFVGVGPAICTVLLSMPLGAYPFVVGASYSLVPASFYLTFPHEEGDSVTPTLQQAGARV